MKRKTNIEQVQSIAKMLLMTDVRKTEYSPIVVQHPFTSTGIVMLPGKSTKDFGIIDITQNRKNLNAWQNAVSSAIDNTESAYRIYMMINKPYGLTFLKYAEPHLSQDDFSKILTSAWIMSEAPHNNPDVSLRELVSMFQAANPTVLMDEDEYDEYQKLADPVTVYRGVTEYNAENIRALSWTLNRDTAEWFAQRFGENGTVYKAQISKQHIFAIFRSRNESEVIVDPKYLMDISEVYDMSSDFILS